MKSKAEQRAKSGPRAREALAAKAPDGSSCIACRCGNQSEAHRAGELVALPALWTIGSVDGRDELLCPDCSDHSRDVSGTSGFWVDFKLGGSHAQP